MRKLMIIALAGVVLGVATTSEAALSDAECQGIRDRQKAIADELCRKTLQAKDVGFLQYALSGLWLDENLDQANEMIRRAYVDVLLGAESEKISGDNKMTPELAASYKGKWKMRLWLRIYFMFNDKSAYFPGRLEPDVQEKLETLFWNYGLAKSHIERAQLKYIWAIQGSENHDMMDLSSAFLALQALQDLPAYRDRKLADGHTAREHVVAWTEYYKLYCDERAKYGLFVEISTSYNKWFLPELVNMAEFAVDPVLRKKMEMLLHLNWADWAGEQLGGVRGGGKTRVYQGHYCHLGTSDAWRGMSRCMLGQDDGSETFLFDPNAGQANYVVATSNYRLPDVVIDLALDEAGRGDYVYESLRPAKMVYPASKDRPPLEEGCWYELDTDDPRMVRYNYCTPDYILGSIWVDPHLGTGYRVDAELEAGLLRRPGRYPLSTYAAVSSQNRWQGIIFATDVNARVFPQCKSLVNSNYHQQIAVQQKNVMLVQKNRTGKGHGSMRVYFSAGMKARLLERDGWFFLTEGQAYLAVRALPRLSNNILQGYNWDKDYGGDKAHSLDTYKTFYDCDWLRPQDAYAPVALVTGGVTKFPALEDFIAYIKTHTFEMKDGVLTYSFNDIDGAATTMKMYVEGVRLPEINGTPIELRPEKVYDSPYISSQYGSGVVTIQKGERKLVLDFNKTQMREN